MDVSRSAQDCIGWGVRGLDGTIGIEVRTHSLSSKVRWGTQDMVREAKGLGKGWWDGHEQTSSLGFYRKVVPPQGERCQPAACHNGIRAKTRMNDLSIPPTPRSTADTLLVRGFSRSD